MPQIIFAKGLDIVGSLETLTEEVRAMPPMATLALTDLIGDVVRQTITNAIPETGITLNHNVGVVNGAIEEAFKKYLPKTAQKRLEVIEAGISQNKNTLSDLKSSVDRIRRDILDLITIVEGAEAKTPATTSDNLSHILENEIIVKKFKDETSDITMRDIEQYFKDYVSDKELMLEGISIPKASRLFNISETMLYSESNKGQLVGSRKVVTWQGERWKIHERVFERWLKAGGLAGRAKPTFRGSGLFD